MNKTAKNLGYGFSALVLALSSVVITTKASYATDAEDACKKDSVNAVAYDAAKTTRYICKDGVDLGLVNDLTASTTIDLNGHSITANFVVDGDYTLTVTDSSEDKSGSITAKDSKAPLVAIKAGSKAKVKVEAGTFAGGIMFGRTSDSATANNAADSITIEGGDFSGVTLTDGDSTIKHPLSEGKISGGIFAEDVTDYLKDATISVFESNGKYYVEAISTFTPAADYSTALNKKKEAVFSTTYLVDEDNSVYNTLTFKAEKYNTTTAKYETVTLADYFTVKVNGTVKRDKDGNITSNTLTADVTALKAGQYKITATTLDGVEDDVVINAYAFDPAEEIQDIYIDSTATGATDKIDITSLINAYTGGNVAVTAASSDNAAIVAAWNDNSDGKVTIKAASNTAEGEAEVTVTLADDSAFKFTVYALNTTDEVVFVDTNAEDAEEVALSNLWGAPTNKDATIASGIRSSKTAEKDNLYVIASKVGNTEITFTAGGDAWVYDDGKIVTDADKVEALEKTVTVHAYETSDVALEASSDKAVKLSDLITLPTGVYVTNADIDSATNISEGSGNSTLTDEEKKDPANWTYEYVADGTSTIKVTVSDGTKGDELESGAIYTYTTPGTTNKVETTGKAYVDIAKGKEYTVANIVANENSVLSFSSSRMALSEDETKVVYTPLSSGVETITVTETLAGETIGTYKVEYTTYGIGADETIYATPGETVYMTVLDKYGTIAYTADAGLDVSAASGEYSFSAAKEGKYEVTFTETLTDTGAATANGSATVAKKVTIIVAENYITSDNDEATLYRGDADRNSAVFTLTTPLRTKENSETSLDVDITTVDGVEADDGDIFPSYTYETTDNKDTTTYKVTVTGEADLGTYLVTFNLMSSNGKEILASTEATVEVVEDLSDQFTLKEGKSNYTGVFTLASSLDEDLVVDIDGGSGENGANVQLYKSNETVAQQFQLIANGDGTVTLKNLRSGKVLDVYGGIAEKGTNVQQYESNGTASQKWVPILVSEELDEETGDRTKLYVKFVSALDSSLVLDVNGGVAKNGTNVQIYEDNGTDSQIFSLILDKDAPIAGLSDFMPVKKQAYTITSTLDDEFALDVYGGLKADGTNVQIYTANDTASQQFTFVDNEDGTFTIASALDSNKVLDVDGGSTKKGANVQLYTANGSNAQKWVIEEVEGEEDTYMIKSLVSGLYLDVDGGVAKDGRNVQMYTGNKTASQKFVIKAVETE